MDAESVRSLAKTLPEVEMTGAPGAEDFRVAGRIFATLPSPGHLVLKLTPDQRDMVTGADPAIYAALDGVFGTKGWTSADVGALDEASALSGLMMAWSNVAPKRLSRT